MIHPYNVERVWHLNLITLCFVFLMKLNLCQSLGILTSELSSYVVEICNDSYTILSHNLIGCSTLSMENHEKATLNSNMPLFTWCPGWGFYKWRGLGFSYTQNNWHNWFEWNSFGWYFGLTCTCSSVNAARKSTFIIA